MREEPASAAAWNTLSLSQSIELLADRSRSFRRRVLMFVLMRGEKLFCLKRRHAALSGGGHRLPVDVVGDVACGEHARH